MSSEAPVTAGQAGSAVVAPKDKAGRRQERKAGKEDPKGPAPSRKAERKAEATEKTKSSKRPQFEGFRRIPAHVKDQLQGDAEAIAPVKDSLAKLHPVFHTAFQQLLECDTCVSTRVKIILEACNAFVTSYERPAAKAFSWHLNEQLAQQLEIISQFQPFTPGIQHAIKFLRAAVSKIQLTLPDEEAKTQAINASQQFIAERVNVTGEFVKSDRLGLLKRLDSGSKVVVFGYSAAVMELLVLKHRELCAAGKTGFTTVVVDARPALCGQGMAKALVAHGIECAYAHITGVRAALSHADLVLLDGTCVDVCGDAIVTAGADLLAAAAHALKIPVFIIAETYKLTEQVFLDAATVNEAHSSDVLAHTSCTRAASTFSLASALSAPAAAPAEAIKPHPRKADKDKAPVPVIQPWKSTGLKGDSSATSAISSAKDSLRSLPLAYGWVPAGVISGYITEVGQVSVSELNVLFAEFAKLDEAAQQEDDADGSEAEESGDEGVEA